MNNTKSTNKIVLFSGRGYVPDHNLWAYGAHCDETTKNTWDPEKEEFVNDREANAMRTRIERPHWELDYFIKL